MPVMFAALELQDVRRHGTARGVSTLTPAPVSDQEEICLFAAITVPGTFMQVNNTPTMLRMYLFLMRILNKREIIISNMYLNVAFRSSLSY